MFSKDDFFEKKLKCSFRHHLNKIIDKVGTSRCTDLQTKDWLDCVALHSKDMSYYALDSKIIRIKVVAETRTSKTIPRFNHIFRECCA